jgi:hypothetical protein
MKRKIVYGAIVIILLVQAQTVFADHNEDFINAAKRNDLRRMEQLIQRNANRMNLDYCMTLVGQNSISDSTMIEALRLLFRHGANINSKQYDPLFSIMIYRPNSSDIIKFLLNEGANPDNNNGTPFITVLRNRNLELAALMLQKGANIDLRQSIGDVDRVALRWVSESQEGTPLMIMARDGYFAGVKFLVENGAKINLRDSLGRTAASLAYDRGEIEIYNYLKENGAIDFEPRQVANQPVSPNPSSTTNVYVQPSVPAQPPPAPVQSAPSGWNLSVLSGANNIGGTWTSSVGNGFMVLNGNGSSGSVNIQVNGMLLTGTATISGNSLNLYITSGQFAGQQFRYTIVTNRLIQGDGENFSR